jgi:hypothetical protein
MQARVERVLEPSKAQARLRSADRSPTGWGFSRF